MTDIAKQIEQCDKVVAYCRDIGIELEPWQEATLRATLRAESYMRYMHEPSLLPVPEPHAETNCPRCAPGLGHNTEAGIQHDG